MLTRYALEAVSSVNRLVVTHVDMLGKVAEWTACCAWTTENGERIERLEMPRSIAESEERTRLAMTVRPLVVSCEPDAALAKLEELLDMHVDLVARGVTAGDIAEYGHTNACL